MLWPINIADGKVKRGASQLNPLFTRCVEVQKQGCQVHRGHERNGSSEKSDSWKATKRDNNLARTIEYALDEENEEYKDKCALEQLGSQWHTEEEEADEASEPLKNMFPNVEEADARVERTRNRFFHELEEYIRKWRREDGRVGFYLHNCTEICKVAIPNRWT